MTRSSALVLLGGLLAVASIFVDPCSVFPALCRSWFFSPARIGDLRIAVGTLGIVVAAAPLWLAFLRRETGVAAGTEPERPAAKARRIPWAVDALFVAALIAAAAAEWTRDDPIIGDTKRYLGLALDVAEHGGVLGLLGQCLRGTWPEDNVHPLFLSLIAPWASRSNAFLATARVVSLAGGVLTLWLCLRACRRRGGEVAAVAGGLLIVTNATFLEHSVSAGPESWWMAGAVAAFDTATRDDSGRTRARWFFAGAFVGLAFLAKGTGSLLLIATAAWNLVDRGRRAWKPLALVVAGFAAAALPLLVRNVRRFGDPLWNVNTRRGFWLDSFDQLLDPATRDTASASTYLASHSPGQIVIRMAAGAAKEVVLLLESFAPFQARAAFGVPVLVLLVAGVVTMKDRRVRTYLTILGAIWFVSFSWYAPIASERRFAGVLLPVAVPAVIAWTSRLRSREGACAEAVGLAVALGVLVTGGVRGRSIVRAMEFEPAPWNEPLRAYLKERAGRDANVFYLLGPSSSLGFDWDMTLMATRHARPHDQVELDRWLSESEAPRYRFLVVEWPPRSQRLGDAWVASDAGGGIRAEDVPRQWHPVAAFPAGAPRVLVFERR